MAVEVSASTVVRRREHVVSERFGDETVVLDPVEDRYVRLNGAATLLWAALGAAAPISELTEVLARAYGLPVPRARDDVRAFVASVEAKGLVELSA